MITDEQFTNAQRANVITQALPYIRKYYGKVIVVKYGGNAMTNEYLKHEVMQDIALLRLIGVKVILVHGGGPEISSMMSKLGKKAEFVDGLRVTDSETVGIVQMVLAGKINKSLVAMLEKLGSNAVGLSGMDGGLIEAHQKDEKLGYVGEVTKINVGIINDLIEKDYIPVVSTLGFGKDGSIYNINGDTAAAYIAGAVGAKRLILMTDVAGVMKDKNDPSSIIRNVTIDDAQKLKEDGTISGGMIPKIECCVNAIHRGVDKVIIMDGRVHHAILMELLTDEGAGTMVKR